VLRRTPLKTELKRKPPDFPSTRTRAFEFIPATQKFPFWIILPEKGTAAQLIEKIFGSIIVIC
jgi:hypothetical protein